MQESSRKFLEKIMMTSSPSGYEHQLRKIWIEEMKKFSDNVKPDIHGNVIASINSAKKPSIMLAGHIDELGFQVSYIDDNGFISFHRIGGFDIGIIPGRKVRIHTKNSDILGITGKKAIHLFEKEDREKKLRPHQLYIDIGAKSKKEAAKIVELGDPITYDANFEELRNGLFTSKGFDDKIGAFVVAEVMKNIFKQKDKLKSSLYSVATCQEEVGLRGARTSAYGINPDIGIAVDVTNCSDTPDVESKKFGEIKINAGASIARGPNINPRIYEILVKIAKENKIKYQIEPRPYPTGTDANVIQITRAGVAAGLVSVPCRYMHTYTEVISLPDVECVIDILTRFCFYINKKIDLIPL